jgi:hypothetical protein
MYDGFVQAPFLKPDSLIGLSGSDGPDPGRDGPGAGSDGRIGPVRRVMGGGWPDRAGWPVAARWWRMVWSLIAWRMSAVFLTGWSPFWAGGLGVDNPLCFRQHGRAPTARRRPSAGTGRRPLSGSQTRSPSLPPPTRRGYDDRARWACLSSYGKMATWPWTRNGRTAGQDLAASGQDQWLTVGCVLLSHRFLVLRNTYKFRDSAWNIHPSALFAAS